MESLDIPTSTAQPYSDSRNSPMDPAVFNNKRDSAYSSFSASSNTSDYAMVPLRPGEACSMDNLLQSSGPSCRGYSGADTSTLGRSSGESPNDVQLVMHKSRSLNRPRTRSFEVKERPSSCCYEDERRGGNFEIPRNEQREAESKRNPPQPPTRKDSFRATQSCSDAAHNRCVSAPSEISPVACDSENKSSVNVELGIYNGFSVAEDEDRTQNFKENSLDLHSLQRQTKDISIMKCGSNTNKEHNSESTSDQLPDPVTASLALTPSSHPGSLPAEPSVEAHGQSHLRHSQNRHSSTLLHRHSAPEKLLATQLQLLEFKSDSSLLEPYIQSNPKDCSLSSGSSPWSHSFVQPVGEGLEASHNHLDAHANKWESSRCSTPGSVFSDGNNDIGISSDRLEVMAVNGECLPSNEHQHSWGRSVSAPGERTEMSAHGELTSDQTIERDFEPLSSAASIDTLLEEQKTMDKEKGVKKVGEETNKRTNSSRNHLRNRRRSERFATNLRNEIQRKKAQLQRGCGPGGLLCSGQTVKEEEGPEVNEEWVDPNPRSMNAQEWKTAVTYASPVSLQVANTTAPVEKSHISSKSSHDVLQTQSQRTVYTENTNRSRSVQILDPGVRSFGVGIRVVEEPAPAGKARRWRWTPEHKLQPEPEPDQHYGVVTGSRHGVCAFTSSSHSRSSSCSRIEESDILPFADRMKFFEETSKGMPASIVPSLSSHRQKKPHHQPGIQGRDLSQQHPTQRRYSYQGGIHQESSLLPNTMETRRLSVSTSRDRLTEKEREAREKEERARETEKRLREMERQQEMEKQEMEVELKRLREIQLEREREERVRQWEKERERELVLEREKEMERSREIDCIRKEREKLLEREREKPKDDSQFRSHQECYGGSGITERNFQEKDNFHSLQPKPQALSHIQVSQSAFHPIATPSQPPEYQKPPHQGYTVRSYTPTEVRIVLSLKKIPCTVALKCRTHA